MDSHSAAGGVAVGYVMTSARLCTGTTFVLIVLIRSVCCGAERRRTFC